MKRGRKAAKLKKNSTGIIRKSTTKNLTSASSTFKGGRSSLESRHTTVMVTGQTSSCSCIMAFASLEIVMIVTLLGLSSILT